MSPVKADENVGFLIRGWLYVEPGPWEAKRITPLASDITRIHLPPAPAAKAPSLVNVSLSRSSWRHCSNAGPLLASPQGQPPSLPRIFHASAWILGRKLKAWLPLGYCQKGSSDSISFTHSPWKWCSSFLPEITWTNRRFCRNACHDNAAPSAGCTLERKRRQVRESAVISSNIAESLPLRAAGSAPGELFCLTRFRLTLTWTPPPDERR